MKITTTKIPPPPPEFVPCSITIDFENQEELDALTSLFNSGRLNHAMNQLFPNLRVGDRIWNKLNLIGGSTHFTDAITNRLKENIR